MCARLRGRAAVPASNLCRLAKLDRLKEDICGWLRLPATQTSWQGLVEHLWGGRDGRQLVQTCVRVS